MRHQKIFKRKIEAIDVNFKFKGIIIGDLGVGKTSILRKLNSYDLKYGGFKNFTEFSNFYLVVKDKVV